MLEKKMKKKKVEALDWREADGVDLHWAVKEKEEEVVNLGNLESWRERKEQRKNSAFVVVQWRYEKWRNGRGERD